MINFTVGPVQMGESVRKIGYDQVPYFRTQEFSDIMLESESLMKKFAGAEDDSRVIFLTGSGTASMEAAIINTLGQNDKVLVVNGGSFGQRFVQLCKIHNINYEEIVLEIGEPLTESILKQYDNKGYTAFLVNVCETSTGVHYDIDLIGNFCRRNNLFLIVDAISSFLVDPIDMTKNNIDVLITGSQKALACPPGVSIITLSKRALEVVAKTNSGCMYLDLKDALKNMERGQTPFTPAVGILLQIHQRLKDIEENGGVAFEISKTENLAKYFRDNIKELPFEMVTQSPSNGVTALYAKNNNAYNIFLAIKDEYGMWICPNGGEVKDKIFRVGHMGNLSIADYDKLINAFRDLYNKGRL